MVDESVRLLIVGGSALVALLVVAFKGRAITGEIRTLATRGRVRKGVLPLLALLIVCVTTAVVFAIPAVYERASAATGSRCVAPTRECTIGAGEVGSACVCYDFFTGRGEVGTLRR